MRRPKDPRCWRRCGGVGGGSTRPCRPLDRLSDPSQASPPKKTKVVPKELRQDAPILRVLGRAHVPLEPLVAGEPTVSTVVNLGVIRTVETDRMTYMRVQQPPHPHLGRPRDPKGDPGAGVDLLGK